MLPDKIRGFKIQRNPSWRSSARTGLYYGVWFAPSTLAVAVGRPVIAAIDALGAAILRGASWAVLCVGLIAFGLAGFVTPDDVNQD